MQAVLVMFRSDGERRSFSITRDMTIIGRREDCDLRIPLGDISRKHCRLVRDGDLLKVEDLGSSNGTFLNGQRVQESLLTPGDSIQVGPVVFVLQVDGKPADDELQPIEMAPAVPQEEVASEELEEVTPTPGNGAAAESGELGALADPNTTIGSAEESSFNIVMDESQRSNTGELQIDLDIDAEQPQNPNAA